MSDEKSRTKGKSIEKLRTESGIEFPQEYLNFLQSRDKYDLEVEAGSFEIYSAEDVIQVNRDLQVGNFIPGFFVFGGDRANELFAHDTREPKPWKIYMIPMIVMSEKDAVVIADKFDSFVKLSN